MLKFHNSFVSFLIFVLSMFSIIIVALLFNFIFLSETMFLEINLMSLRNFKMNFVLLADIMSLLFLLSVSIITLAVMKFSSSYMTNDRAFFRFHLLVLVFVFSMYFLIVSPNMISLLLGWDGLGLSSYLLVIYYGSPKAYNSGMITALTNRVGDALILISIGYLMMLGDWNFFFYSSSQISSLILGLIMIAACTKSAQIPFSAWLPAAMAAPTPVSSLVHSSTLVTAGTYILIRHNELFLLNSISMILIIAGASTMMMASMSALFETDLKKMVALSTLSQLGIMVLALGMGACVVSFFHLLSHAFFKALLFIVSGSIIHNSGDYQDLRLMGNSSFALPVANSFTIISIFSLMGAPWMSAFFSKELILEMFLVSNFNMVVYGVMVSGIMLTALYSSRFLALIFFRSNYASLLIFKLDEDKAIIMSMFVLAFPAMGSGLFLSLMLQTSLEVSSSLNFSKVSIILILILSSYMMFYQSQLHLSLLGDKIYWVLSSMWALPMISAQAPVASSSKMGAYLPKIFDRGILSLPLNLLYVYFDFTMLGGFSFNFINKIVSLIFIWGMTGLLIYLCKMITMNNI